MTQRYSKILLRKLRNSISIEMLIADILKPVSYTHLTLPTIYSV